MHNRPFSGYAEATCIVGTAVGASINTKSWLKMLSKNLINAYVARQSDVTYVRQEH